MEMIVSVGLFSAALFIIMVSLFSIVTAQKKAIAIQNAQDNLRFAFEAMTKEIRTGKEYHCGTTGILSQPQNCDFPNGSDSFTFRNINGQRVTYQIYQNQLVKSSNGTPPCVPDDTDITDCQRVTSPQVVIVDRIAFYVDGALGADDEQSIVTIVLEGKVIDPKGLANAEINLQTTVSKRALTDQP